MIVKIRYLAQLRHAAGRATDTIDLASGSTVAELLRKLAVASPALADLLLTAQGQVQPTLMIFLRDYQIDAGQTLDGDDEVMLMTPIAGGQDPCCSR